MNGDSIRVDRNGNILDGQHRLTACVQSGKSFQTIMVTGLDPDVFGTIDRGKLRTVGEILSIDGVQNYNMVAGASRMAMVWRSCGLPESGVAINNPTAVQVQEFVQDNPDIVTAAHYVAGKSWLRKYLRASQATYCVFTFMRSSHRADEFFQSLISGSSLDQKSPILALRDRLISEKSAVSKISSMHITALVFKAFKKFISDSQVTHLRIRVRGENEEDMIKIFSLEEAA